MYAFISAIAKPINGDGRWRDVNIADVPLNVLFSTYSKIFAILSNPFLTNNVSLDLANIRPATGGLTVTFAQFLVDNADNTLPTSETLPVINSRYAKYADGFHAGYAIAPAHPTASPDAQLPESEKTWLHLTKFNVDYTLFYNHCLVSVNGFYHATDGGGDGIYVQNGMISCRLAKKNQIGIYSFRELGKLTFVPITANMLYKQRNDQSFKNKCFVDLGVDTTGKTVMLVLGGYLHVLDHKTVFRVGDSRFAVDFGNLPFLDRYFESRDFIDLSSLNLDSTEKNPTQINVAQLYSDESITAYMTLSQSFFVLLDNEEIFVNKVFVRPAPMPGMYTAYTVPSYPLSLAFGKHANYWYTYEDGQYSITCVNSIRRHPLYDTVNRHDLNNVSQAEIPDNPGKNSEAFFLEIGSDI